MSLLAAKATHFGHSHAVNSVLRQGVLDVFQLEVANNRFNFFS